jgi:hypothetical protein
MRRVRSPRGVWITTRTRPSESMPRVMKRCSPSESGSSMDRAHGSRSACSASHKLTPCLRRLERAFVWSYSIATSQLYAYKMHTVNPCPSKNATLTSSPACLDFSTSQLLRRLRSIEPLREETAFGAPGVWQWFDERIQAQSDSRGKIETCWTTSCHAINMC